MGEISNTILSIRRSLCIMARAAPSQSSSRSQVRKKERSPSRVSLLPSMISYASFRTSIFVFPFNHAAKYFQRFQRSRMRMPEGARLTGIRFMTFYPAMGIVYHPAPFVNRFCYKVDISSPHSRSRIVCMEMSTEAISSAQRFNSSRTIFS